MKRRPILCCAAALLAITVAGSNSPIFRSSVLTRSPLERSGGDFLLMRWREFHTVEGKEGAMKRILTIALLLMWVGTVGLMCTRP